MSEVIYVLIISPEVIMYLGSFVLEKQVSDAIKSAEVFISSDNLICIKNPMIQTFDRTVRRKKPLAQRGPSLADIAENQALPYRGNTGVKVIDEAITAIKKAALPSSNEDETSIGSAITEGTRDDDGKPSNRESRRLQAKLRRKPPQ